MSDNQRLILQFKLNFLTKSVDEHVADIKQVAKNNGIPNKEALET